MPDESAPNGAPLSLERRLATILCADVAGYSHMMDVNEERTVRVFRGHREIFESLVKLHRGRIFNTAGDALLAEFNSAVEAVRCATEIQEALRTRNEHLTPEERMLFRVGINLGDVIVQGDDLLGDGVNIAARIQTSTQPGGICISGSVYDQIQNKLSLAFKPLGEQMYKNIAKPVRTYTINEGAVVTTPASRQSLKRGVAIAVAVLVIGGVGYWGYRQYDARRADQVRAESQLAAALAAQKQASEQAQRVAEAAKRDAQLQAQKQTAEDTLRRVQEERDRLEQARKLLETQNRAADAAQKQAAEEARRRAEEERNRLEQDRKALETEKQAADAALKQRAAGARATQYDGTYNGQLCNHFKNDVKPHCWQVALIVRNGIAEGSWFSQAEKTSTAHGTVAADGVFELKVAGWTRGGSPNAAVLVGRVADDTITASGQWRGGAAIVGDWKRASKSAAQYEGTYNGQLCNHFKNDAKPNCWPVALVVRNGIAEGSWLSQVQKTSTASGTVTADGTVELKVMGWTRGGSPNAAVLVGRVADDTITASGQWRGGAAIVGDWKRVP